MGDAAVVIEVDHHGLTQDAWENLVTGLGRANRDKRMGGRVKTPPVFMDEQTASDLYHGDDVSQQLADVPPKEMLRQWVTLKVEELSTKPATRTEEQDKQNSETLAKVTKEADQKMETLEAKAKLFEAMVWARVFGGSLMFLGVDDGLGGDPRNLSKPLNKDKIQRFTFLKVFDRHEVSIVKRYDDDSIPKFGEPEAYSLHPRSGHGMPTSFANTAIHETRFIRFNGVLTSRERRIANDSWSDSIYIRMEELLKDFGLSWAGIAHLIQDFAQAIFKMKGLKAALAADKDDVVIDRMIIMDMCRSLTRAIPLDADGEDFERKQTPVTGLADLMDRFEARVASAAKMPITLLFGRSPGGLNATGDSDIRLFYDRISADQETDLRSHIELLYQLIFLSADGPTRGKEPEQWSFTFNPLWQMTPQEQAELQKTTAEADAINISQGVYTADEAAQSHYGSNGFTTEITLDQEKRAAIAEVDASIAGMSEEELAALTAAQADPVDPLTPVADPAAPVPELDQPGGEPTIIEPSTSLNGAQVTSLLELVDKVARREMPRASAQSIITASFNVEPAISDAMLGEVGKTFFVETPEPSPSGAVPPQLANQDQALHHTHWDPEQNDFMGPEAIDPVTGEHIHERPDGSKSQPAPTGAPHRHRTGVGASGESVPWFGSEAEERDHFLPPS